MRILKTVATQHATVQRYVSNLSAAHDAGIQHQAVLQSGKS